MLYYIFSSDNAISHVENGTDYLSTAGDFTFNAVNITLYIPILIMDNSHTDDERYIVLGITSDCGINIWIQIFIWDDETGRLVLLNSSIVAVLYL